MAEIFATNDRYAVKCGLVPIPDGIATLQKSGGGILLISPKGESTDNEVVLADMRRRGVDKIVWSFTQRIFDDCRTRTSGTKDEL